MNAYEILTLLGLIVGPLSAVLITLWSQARSATRDKQLHTFRKLIGTRHLVADPAYSVAINMIPVDFNRQPKIMAAWEKYMDAAFYKPSPENKGRHESELTDKQTRLIFEISKHLKYQISESDLEKRSYASQSFVDRDQLGIQAQVSWIRIANALEAQNSAAGLPTGPAPEKLIPEQPAPEESPK